MLKPVERIAVGDFIVGAGRVRAVHNFSALFANRERTNSKYSGHLNALQYAAVLAEVEDEAYHLKPDCIVVETALRRLAFKVGQRYVVEVLSTDHTELAEAA